MSNRALFEVVNRFKRQRDAIHQGHKLKNLQPSAASEILSRHNLLSEHLNHAAHRTVQELLEKRRLLTADLDAVNNLLKSCTDNRDSDFSRKSLNQLGCDAKFAEGLKVSENSFSVSTAKILQKLLEDQNRWLQNDILKESYVVRDLMRDNNLLWQSSLHRTAQVIETLPNNLTRENAFSQLSAAGISFGRFLNQTNRLFERTRNEKRQNQLLTALSFGRETFRNGISRLLGTLEQLRTNAALSDDILIAPPQIGQLNLFRVTRREVLAKLDEHISEDAKDALPLSVTIQNLSLRLLDLISEINFNERLSGHDQDVFKVTNQTLKCSTVLPFMIVENLSLLCEFIDLLFPMLHEGAGSGEPRFVAAGYLNSQNDSEFKALTALKDLRGKWFSGDQADGSDGNVRGKFKGSNETLYFLGLNGSLEQRDEYVKLQINLLIALNNLLELILNRIKEKNIKSH